MDLEDTVYELRDEVRSLRSEVRRLRRQLECGQVDVDSRSVGAGSQRSSRADSVSSYSLVGSVIEREFNERASKSRSDQVASESRSPSEDSGAPSNASSSRCPLTWLEREAICDEIAAFIRRSLAGDHRVASGRDRIPLPSRIWLVFKDFNGETYRPSSSAEVGELAAPWSSAERRLVTQFLLGCLQSEKLAV